MSTHAPVDATAGAISKRHTVVTEFAIAYQLWDASWLAGARVFATVASRAAVVASRADKTISRWRQLGVGIFTL
jgi:hypothetical protein